VAAQDASDARNGHASSGLFGCANRSGGPPGGQAEYIRAPFSDVPRIVIPHGFRDDIARFQFDILATGWMAVENAEKNVQDEGGLQRGQSRPPLRHFVSLGTGLACCSFTKGNLEFAQMASRAVWKGQLRLSLVSIAVEVHSATQAGARVSFRQIHGPSGQRVRYDKSVPGIGTIKSSDILSGYELGEDTCLLIEPTEIDAIKLETKKTFELVQFVDTADISPLYYDKPYYIVPTDDLAEDAYRVVRDALRKSGKVGLGQLTMRGREHLCAVRPCGDGLLMETLYHADEVRSAEPLFASSEDGLADADLLSVATQLIDRKTAPFDPAVFKDRYDLALRAMIDAKKANRKTPRTTPANDGERLKGANVVDLMRALQDSLKADDKGAWADRKVPARNPRAKMG
jgi:DNA end-binding protein Ku